MIHLKLLNELCKLQPQSSQLSELELNRSVVDEISLKDQGTFFLKTS